MHLDSVDEVYAWKDWLAYHLIETYASVLPKALADEEFAFEGPVLSGTQKQRPRWQRGVAVVMGARVALLGTAIQRRALRHYLGRLFATAASIILGLPVYDTQCGAKFFRDTPALRGALTGPFSSRWAFDVELIGRLLRGDGGAAPLGAADFVEIPLRCWTDVPGSKVSSVQMMRAACDLVAVARELRGRARASRAPIP